MSFIRKHWIEFVIAIAVQVAFVALQFIGMEDYIFSGYFNMRDGSIYVALSIGVLFNSVILFANVYWLIPKYLAKRRIAIYFLILIFFTGGCTIAEVLVDELLTRSYNLPESLASLYDPDEARYRRDIGLPIVAINSVIILLSFGYRFTRDWIAHEAIKRKLTEEKLHAELNFLKSQINPHLLFNTLNAIFSKARKNEDFEVANALQKLSEIIRYMLTDSGGLEIELEQELKLITNLIELQKLRIGEDDLVIKLEVNGNLSGVNIAPLLLISFVENAFKYGINNSGASIISISLGIQNGSIVFTTRNKIFRNDSTLVERDSGIGLSNVKRRLELSYPGNYELNINDSGGYFEVELKLAPNKMNISSGVRN